MPRLTIRSKVEPWEGDAAVRLTPDILLRAGLRVGQQVDLIAEAGRVVVRRRGQQAPLDALLARYDAAEHHHDLILDTPPPVGEDNH